MSVPPPNPLKRSLGSDEEELDPDVDAIFYEKTKVKRFCSTENAPQLELEKWNKVIRMEGYQWEDRFHQRCRCTLSLLANDLLNIYTGRSLFTQDVQEKIVSSLQKCIGLLLHIVWNPERYSLETQIAKAKEIIQKEEILTTYYPTWEKHLREWLHDVPTIVTTLDSIMVGFGPSHWATFAIAGVKVRYLTEFNSDDDEYHLRVNLLVFIQSEFFQKQDSQFQIGLLDLLVEHKKYFTNVIDHPIESHFEEKEVAHCVKRLAMLQRLLISVPHCTVEETPGLEDILSIIGGKESYPDVPVRHFLTSHHCPYFGVWEYMEKS